MSEQQLQLTETGFPQGFAWGAATAAYQIEGAAHEDGRGETIWDRFSHTPGKIERDETGDVACDHYHRWQEDIDILSQLNFNAYRFSIAWSRILPEGYGKLNGAGLDFYERLVDTLLARGITPFATLYHWDLPQGLQDRGGWRNRDTAYFFADYAQSVARRLGDRVSHWITHNEPHVVVFEGYVNGTMAPGQRDRTLIAPIAHHLLLSHGLAVQALRTELPQSPIGITLNVAHIEPATDREEDVQAAQLEDGLHHRWFLDALYRARYPEDVASKLALPDDLVRAGDMETIAQPLDFLGLNYYSRNIIRASRRGTLLPQQVPPRGKLTAMGWEVYPDGLYQLLLRLHNDYHPPKLYITESGAAYPDVVDERGEVHDPERLSYLRRHFQEARRALADGVPLHGYLAWSLLDNFEWAHGYRPRFGLVRVDYATQKRTIKDSGFFVGRVAATNGGALDE